MPKYTVVPGELKGHHLVLSRIKAALQSRDFSSIIIFPTLSLLNEIREEIMAGPELNGLGGVRLLLFEGFIEELVGRFGIEGRRPSSIEQELLITEAFNRLVQVGALSYLNRIPFSASYRQALLEGIREWKRAGLTPEILKEWASDQNAKEKELALVYQAYQQLLIHRGIQEEDLILNRLAKQRAEAGKVPETDLVMVYGFTDLTPLQNDYLKILEFWFDFEFIIDPTTAPVLQKMVARQFPVKFPDYEATPTNNALEKLQNYLWIEKPGVIGLQPEDYSLRLIQAAGSIREAAAIAREIVGIMLGKPGCRWEDFLIITPNPREFCKTAEPIFKKYGLHLRGSENRTGREFPALNLFYEMLTAGDNDWQWPEMELLIRHYYAGTDPASGDRFLLWLGEGYGAISSRMRWLGLTQEQGFVQGMAEAGFEIEPLARLLDWLAKIPEQALLKDYLDLAQQWFKSQKFCSGEKFPEDFELLALEVENFQAVQAGIEIIEVIKQTVTGLKIFQTELPLREFQQFINDYWSELTVKPAGGKNQSIRVLPPREARGLRAPVAFITGLEQGKFPRVYVNDWKLGLSDRRDLRSIGIELETGEQYRDQEAFAFYWSIQTAGERLYFVYRDQDGGGQPLNRSIFLDEVLQWVPDLEQRAIRYGLAPRVRSSIEECYTINERKEWLAYTLLKAIDRIGPERLELVRTFLGEEEYYRLALQIHDWNCAEGKGDLGEDRGVDQLLKARFGADHLYSITAIEDYRSCPYRFFLKHVLKARPAPRPTLLPELLDLGILYHAILREFGKRVRGQSLVKGEMERYWEIITEIMTEQYREWRRWTGSELAEMILFLKQEEIRLTLRRWLEAETKWTEATNGRFKMDQFEWGFGIAGAGSGWEIKNQPYRLEDGSNTINIWGRIDRVDTDSDGNFTVYDYKLGKGPVVKDLVELKNLQIPVYLMALEQLYSGSGQAAGGCYLGLREPSRAGGGVWNRDKLGSVLKSKGLLEQAEWDDFLETVRGEIAAAVSGIRSGHFGLTGDDCPKYCEYSSCCRRLEREVSEG